MSFPTCPRCNKDVHSPYEACADLQEMGDILTVAARPKQTIAQTLKATEPQVIGKVDRKAYMRAYMKARRAKAKA